MKNQISHVSKALAAQLLIVFSLCASHNTSKYFPFIERSDQYVTDKRSYFSPNIFYTTASTAFHRGGGNAGIPELWGNYDLRDVIDSVQAVQGVAFVNPIETVTGTQALVGKSLKFKVSSKIRSNGIVLHYEQKVWKNLFVGGWIPAMFVSSTGRYLFDRASSDPSLSPQGLTQAQAFAQEQEIDSIRRLTHDLAGFTKNKWSQSGFGDLDLYLKWNSHLDYRLLMKSVDFNLQGGFTAPTGILSDRNNPLSVSVMGNGHWSVYLDLVSEFELKQDLKIGFMFSYMHQFKHSRNLRLATGNEPTIFSALTAPVSMSPGDTFKISPYITLENLSDGLHIQGRYTYLRHNEDKWRDGRTDQTVQSYLSKGGDLIAQKENISRWRAHYFTFQVTYDTKVALKHYWLDPLFYLTYDMPMNGNGISKTHHLTIGAQLHF